jgi:hypothetical protein
MAILSVIVNALPQIVMLQVTAAVGALLLVS